MALIKCPECKKKVSGKCGQCPHCGYPIEEELSAPANNNNTVKIITNKEIKTKKSINKKLFVSIVSLVAVFLIICGIVLYNAFLPRINATKDLKVAISFVEQKNLELESYIMKAEQVLAKKQPLLDDSLIIRLENSISDAKAVKITNFDSPKKVDEIIVRTNELEQTDYSNTIKTIEENQKALEINAKRYQLVNAPTEAYVIECLKKVPNIIGYSAVTEDNDPNGNLNKQGGYTAQIYFSSDLINQNDIYGDTLIDKGTDAGGSIEIYASVEDAKNREEYLSSFDGGILASGSHIVIGTILIRTSNELTASQQKTVEKNIITVLTGDDENLLEELTPINQENNTYDTNTQSQETSVQTPSYPSAVGTYKYLDYILYIYSNGTLYWESTINSSDPNDENYECPLTGTWSQSNNKICHSVWNTDGFVWNNPFYGTVYYDGIEFIGDYYTRIS